MRPAWTLPVSIIAAIAIGYLLLQFVKYPEPCWRGTTERPIDRSIDRSVVLWRLQKALSDSWKELSYKDDEVLLSKRLNMFAMEINQFICDLEDGVVTTGGWCPRHYSDTTIDRRLANAMAKMLSGRTVGSFGDGQGLYKTAMIISGHVTRYDAYDGSPYIERDTSFHVKYLELTIPQYGLPMYDWVINLEVAEHIPQQFEDALVSNIVRHAKEGIIMSWAFETDGVRHINLRSMEYVEQKMASLCFEVDKNRTAILRQAATFWFFKRNLNVYVRKQDCTVELGGP